MAQHQIPKQKSRKAFGRILSAAATLMLIILSTGAQAQEFIRIKCRWQKDGKTDYRIHIQNPSVDAGATNPGWWSADWVMEKVEGADFYRIRNRWKKDGTNDFYLHNQNGTLEAGAIQPGWWSAHWALEKVDATYYRIKNRWKPTEYLNIQGPALACGAAEPGWWSAQWALEGFTDQGTQTTTTTTTTTNTDTPRPPIWRSSRKFSGSIPPQA